MNQKMKINNAEKDALVFILRKNTIMLIVIQ